MSQRMLELDAVNVTYETSQGALTVLDCLNLKIRAGEFVSLVGPTGCGKSTVLRLFLGSQFPTTGTVRFQGEVISEMGKERGVVFQKYGLFPHLTVLDNIALGPMLSQLNLFHHVFRIFSSRFKRVRKRERERAREYVTSIGLKPEDCGKYPNELSGGMRQRVSIAQSFMMSPRVLLMDEAFSALDPATREELQLLLLNEWNKHQMTVIFVTHNVQEAVFLGARVIGLSQHWEHADGTFGSGARIVLDTEAGGTHPKPVEYKYSPTFNQVVKRIHETVLNKTSRTRVGDFSLSHPDAI